MLATVSDTWGCLMAISLTLERASGCHSGILMQPKQFWRNNFQSSMVSNPLIDSSHKKPLPCRFTTITTTTGFFPASTVVRNQLWWLTAWVAWSQWQIHLKFNSLKFMERSRLCLIASNCKRTTVTVVYLPSQLPLRCAIAKSKIYFMRNLTIRVCVTI